MKQLSRGICMVALFVICGTTFTVVAQEAETGQESWKDYLKEIPLGPGTLNIGGSLRFRYEVYDNYNIKGYGTDETDNVLLERLRLDFEYKLHENLHAFVQLQDAHYWLSDLHVRDFSVICPYENPLDVKKGYVQWTHIGDTPLGLRVGRQAIAYRDSRVWGPGDWGNVGRYTWDAVTLYWDTEVVSADLIGAQRVLNDADRFDEDHFDFDAYGLYARVKKLPFDLDLLYIQKYDDHGTTRGATGLGDLRTQSVGAYLNGTFQERIDWGGLAVYQFGDWGEDYIRAYGYNARLGYTLDAPWTPRLGIEYSFGSGDSDPDDRKHETFDGLFSAVDKFYGRMNMFAWMNLEDCQASFSIKPTKSLKVSLDYHFLTLDENKDAWYYCSGKPQRQDVTGRSGTTLGHEIDLFAKWQATDSLEFFCGYAHFSPGSFVRHTGEHSDADWVFFQTTLFF